jgi:type II secretory pathway pseudopilin PulG
MSIKSVLALKRAQSGDTIVEVLVAMAVVSSVIGGAFVVASRSTNNIRQSQEHTEVQKMIESQVEQLKSAAKDPNSPVFVSNNFCLSGGSVRPDTDPSCTQSAYSAGVRTSIVRNGALYSITATWDGPSGTDEQVNIVYKLYKTQTASTIPLPPAPPPPPPPPPPFSSTTILGSSYTSCVAREGLWHDGADRCFTSGTTMYAWRAVEVLYPVSGLLSGTANIEIKYAQHFNPAPSGYAAFNVDIDIGGSLTTHQLPPGPPNVQQTSNYTVNVPAPVPGVIRVIWLNNYGNDPNLRIDSIRIYR